jgi:hypothetical protein
MPGFYIGQSRPFRDKGDAVSVESHLQNLGDAIGGQLAVNADPKLLTILLELPGIEPALGRKAEVDAGVTCQILRHDWARMMFETIR